MDYVPEFGFFTSNRPPQAFSPMVKLHPQIGRLLNIGPGDLVVVENELGSFIGPAWLSDEVSAATLWCPEGSDPPPAALRRRQPPPPVPPCSPGASCEASRTRGHPLPARRATGSTSRELLLGFLAARQEEPPLGPGEDRLMSIKLTRPPILGIG